VIRAFTGDESHIYSVAFSPDGKSVLTGSVDKTARLWDAATGKVIRAFTGHESHIYSVAFSPDGKVLPKSANR
jgi:WD40 repeat protein